MKKVKVRWYKKDEKYLLKLVKEHGKSKWSVVTKCLNSVFPNHKKTEDECRNKYKTISRQTSSNNWLVEEEFIFFQMHSLIGNKWKEISIYFPNKTDIELKNHFYSSINKTLRHISSKKHPKSLKEKIQSYYAIRYMVQNSHEAKTKEREGAEKMTSLESNNSPCLGTGITFKKEVNLEKVISYSVHLNQKVLDSDEIHKLIMDFKGLFSFEKLEISEILYFYIKKLVFQQSKMIQNLNASLTEDDQLTIQQFIQENSNLSI